MRNANGRIRRSNADGQRGGSNADSRMRRVGLGGRIFGTN